MTFLEIGQTAISASLFRDKEIEDKEIVNQSWHRESFHQWPMKHCLMNYAWGDASVDENIAPCSLTLFCHASVYSSEKTR